MNFKIPTNHIEHCVYCGADTQLYASGVPICVQCAEDLEAGRQPTLRERPIQPRRSGDSPSGE